MNETNPRFELPEASEWRSIYLDWLYVFHCSIYLDIGAPETPRQVDV